MDRKEKIKDYYTDIGKVIELLNKWDPYQLVNIMDAPKDELSIEASAILVNLKFCKSNEDVIKLVIDIFTEAYGLKILDEDCKEIGNDIWAWWLEESKLKKYV